MTTQYDDQEREDKLHEGLARYPASVFQFDERLQSGWYSDRYFVRTANTLAHEGLNPRVRMQVFAKRSGIVCGIYEVLRMLQSQLGVNRTTGSRFSIFDMDIRTLNEGERVEPWDTVMHIDGPYMAFAHLETDYLGVLARRSLVATNVRRIIDAARGKQVIFMGARHDDWRVQTPDGYAAMCGGIGDVSSNANGAWWGGVGVGTMPHSMIAAFGGDTARATLAFASYVEASEPGVKVVSLVDYHNDAVTESVAVARAMEEKYGHGSLYGVRIDTSEKMVDKALQGRADAERLRGVCPELVLAVRQGLDAEGFRDVKIGVSGGFHVKKIERFEQLELPVDFYGVGSSVLGHNKGEEEGLLNGFDFTADIVRVDGREEHKAGRPENGSDRLVRVSTRRLIQD